MTEDKGLAVHRGLQIYVSVITTALTITVAIIGWQVRDWHTQFVQSQSDIHEMRIELIQKGDIDKFQDYRISAVEKRANDIMP
jgi:hypothetical protein